MSRLHNKKTEVTIEESHKFFIELETRYASINNMTDNDLVKENDEITEISEMLWKSPVPHSGGSRSSPEHPETLEIDSRAY